MKKARKVRSLTFLQGIALNLLKQSILFILLWLIFRHVLTTGEMIAMQFISSAIFGPLQDIGNIILQYREVDASIHNFDTLMRKPIERRPENPDEIGPLEMIRFEDVVFRHRTASFNAVDGISFDCPRRGNHRHCRPFRIGEVHSGEIARGLYTPGQRVHFFQPGRSTNIRFNPLRRQIGFVTQETQLYAGSIKENMRFVKADASDEEILDCLRAVSATKGLRHPSSFGAIGRPQHTGPFSPPATIFSFRHVSHTKVFSLMFPSRHTPLTLLFFIGKNKPFP